MTVHVPEGYWDANGFSVLLRFNSPQVESGNFQLWNANFHNIFRKSTGLEILIHPKSSRANDLEDPFSFVIVGERLPTGAHRK